MRLPEGFYTITGAALILGGLLTALINIFLTTQIDLGASYAAMAGSSLFFIRLMLAGIAALEGADIVGTAFVPYDFNSGRAIVIEAERLVLPGDDEETTQRAPQVDPRSLPPISINVQEMAFGNRFFGTVEANFVRTADGLESQRLVAKDETFEIVGNGKWVLDEDSRKQITDGSYVGEADAIEAHFNEHGMPNEES